MLEQTVKPISYYGTYLYWLFCSISIRRWKPLPCHVYSLSLVSVCTLNNAAILHPKHTLTNSLEKFVNWLNCSTATTTHGFCMWKVLPRSQPVIFCWLATQRWTSGHSPENKLAALLLYTHSHTGIHIRRTVMENKGSYRQWPGCPALSIHCESRWVWQFYA